MKIQYKQEWDTFYQSEDGLAWYKIRLGSLQKDLLHFAYKYPTLHSYDAKRRGKQVKRLVEMGLLQHFPDSQQFKILGV